jgi:hypothetical protein
MEGNGQFGRWVEGLRIGGCGELFWVGFCWFRAWPIVVGFDVDMVRRKISHVWVVMTMKRPIIEGVYKPVAPRLAQAVSAL